MGNCCLFLSNLTLICSFGGQSGVIVIGATNFPESLDKVQLFFFSHCYHAFQALLRPGRFDKLVTVNLPDVRGRKQV